MSGSNTFCLLWTSRMITIVSYPPLAISLSPGDTATDCTLPVCTNNTNLLLEIDAHNHYIRSVVWSPDCRQLLSTFDKIVKFWDACTGRQIVTRMFTCGAQKHARN
ncbi:hypothetical protein M405DRAFT_205538 [Rhizopogon salebrosus TDB-379]|nr:hypothetical protein M405DRAFT_205538 [Rhizopogon salebrosus TDB-379]